MTQKEALDILKTGRNVFLTGAAGSGKTFVLREYVSYLRDFNAHIGITASTGIAATHMGGTTIHSWSGIGIRDSLHKSDLLEIADKQHIKKHVKEASVLVIDEISMLHHFRLDLVDAVVREVKNSDKPFGGMQVVLCGDFFQLPPVRRAGEREAFFAYHSNSWRDLNLKVCYLSEQFRQKDEEYLKVLNSIRSASVSKEIREILESRFGKRADFEPTKLYAHNKNVDAENSIALKALAGKTVKYEMRERGKKSMVELLKKSCLAPENLELKVGAKVMFVKNNFEAGFVNGTLGIVEKCGYEEIKVRTIAGKLIGVEREIWLIEEDGKIRAEINQYPLRLAWAITIHKSQGMSLDAAEVDLSGSFEKGMGYVALSRVRSLDGLFLKGINEKALEVDEEVLNYDKKFREHSKTNSFHIQTMGREKVDKMHSDFKNAIERKEKNPKKLDTVTETKQLLEEGLTAKEAAKKRSLKYGTILDHVEQIRQDTPTFNIRHLQNEIPKNKFRAIYGAFRQVGLSENGTYRLAPVKEILGPKYSYDDLRLVRLFL